MKARVAGAVGDMDMHSCERLLGRGDRVPDLGTLDGNCDLFPENGRLASAAAENNGIREIVKRQRRC